LRIAVINEFSARDKNGQIMQALQAAGMQAHSIGMDESSGEPELTYVHTGLMAGLALYTKAADFVVGGCGTGQGFTISAMQYPGVFCGLITSPLDAWLFSQINGGNCVSLALNKGYGWAGDINLRYIFEKLFCDPAGQGYPPQRRESQEKSRGALAAISKSAHADMPELLKSIDPAIVNAVTGHQPFLKFIQTYGDEKLYEATQT